MGAHKSRLARNYTNVMDRVRPPVSVTVPGFTVIKVDDKPVDFVREKSRPTGPFWAEFNDLTLADLVGTAK